jgi:hypothetical protein
MLLSREYGPAEADEELTGVRANTGNDSKDRGEFFEGTRINWRVGRNGFHDRGSRAREAIYPPMGVTKATPSGGGFFTFEF